MARNRFDHANAATFTKGGRTYKQTANTPTFVVFAQGNSFLSERLRTEDRTDVGALASRIARRHAYEGAWLFVDDVTWICTDGTCDRLTQACYRFRGGRWEHFSGSKITALEA